MRYPRQLLVTMVSERIPLNQRGGPSDGVACQNRALFESRIQPSMAVRCYAQQQLAKCGTLGESFSKRFSHLCAHVVNYRTQIDSKGRNLTCGQTQIDCKGRNLTCGHFWRTQDRPFGRESGVVRSKRGFILN